MIRASALPPKPKTDPKEGGVLRAKTSNPIVIIQHGLSTNNGLPETVKDRVVQLTLGKSNQTGK